MNYDPFVKEDFILPEKWFVKIDSNNRSIIDSWKLRKEFRLKTDLNTKYVSENGGAYDDKRYLSGKTEITFEQFKKYVLKEPIEQPKSIEKWSVGSYVVFLKDFMHINAGYIDVIKETLQNDCVYLEKYLAMDIGRERSGEVKWFATKSEAEEFAKTLVEPVNRGNGILDAVDVKQPLKQAVHCKTQEEWDFITKKLGYKWAQHCSFSAFSELTCISLIDTQYSYVDYLKNDYQILSFQEWCDLNGYKMESNIDLTGRNLKALIDDPQSTTYKKGDIVEIFKKESSNQYRIGKVGGVWWTYTTNNGTASQWELLPEDYKMEKEAKFEVGKWYEITNSYYRKHEHISKFKEFKNNRFYYSERIRDSQLKPINDYHIYPNEVRLCTIEEIQQYLPDGHPDKIKVDREFKVGEYIFVMTKGRCYGDILKVTSVEPDEKDSGIKGTVWIKHENSSFSGGGFRLGSKYRYNEYVRHATPEEINQHLISIGQIPAGEPLNTGIEPNKDGMFKYKQTMPGAPWSGGTIDNHLDATIPTTGNSYNKDFSTSTIPVKSILAEVEFNYLPEPK